MVLRGRAVFGGSAQCSACHGPAGHGTARGPDLTDDEWLHGDGSYESIVGLVKSGVTHREARNGQPMPMRGWVPLDDEHVRMVAAYVWRLSHRRPHATAG